MRRTGVLMTKDSVNMKLKKPCKECPWVVRNKHNDSIINHSKKWNKTHNCHMVNSNIWDTKKECQCVGNKQHIDTVMGIKEFITTPSRQYSKVTVYDEWCWKYPKED